MLDYETIQTAIAGNPLSLQKILDHYDGYMNKILTTRETGANGEHYHRVDEDMKEELKFELIQAILKWKEPKWDERK